MSFRNTLKIVLRPCLINLVGVNSLHECQDKFKCESLVNENSSESCTVTEARNPYNRRVPTRKERIRNNYYHNMVRIGHHYINVKMQKSYFPLNGTPLVYPPDWLLDENSFAEKVKGLFLYHYTNQQQYMNDVTFSFAISINGQMVLKQAFKYQDRETLSPAKPDMVGEIGSITKTFTALMIMKLIEEEEESDRDDKITLDTCVEDILTPDVWPEHFVEDDTSGQKYKNSLRQLLRHMSGVRNNVVSVKASYFRSRQKNLHLNYDGGLKSSIENIKCENIPHPPEVKFNYSNYGYQLLALVYEKRTGRSFVEDLRDELVKMGLYDTDFNYVEDLSLDTLRTYQIINGSQSGMRSTHMNPTWFEASYGLKSTLDDLIKYGNIIANCTLNERNPAAYPLSHLKMSQMMNDKTDRLYTNDDCFGIKTYIRRVIGWELGEQTFPGDKYVKEGQYQINLYMHNGMTTGTLSSLAIMDNPSCKTRGGRLMQKKPLLYPLGEEDHLQNDVVVGALIANREHPQAPHARVLYDLMHLALCEYRRVR